MTLYELNQQFEDLMAQYENGADTVINMETGEIVSIQDALDELAISKEEKVNNTVLYLKNLKCLENGLQTEIDGLKKRKEQVEKKRRNLESYIVCNLGETKKLETPQYKLAVRPSTETIAPTRQDEIMKLPVEFRNETIRWAPNKTAIKAALEQGKEIVGCQLAYKQNLTY